MKRLSGQKTKEKAVEHLLLTNYNQYYRLAYSYVHNENDAGDIVQNAAYKAIKNSGSLREENYAATWLYRIVINEIFTFCRRQKNEPLDAAKEACAEDSYEDLDLKRALESLSPKDKMIVELKYFEDMKLTDIADILEENINTVKSRLYRSLRKLRILIEEECMYTNNQNSNKEAPNV